MAPRSASWNRPLARGKKNASNALPARSGGQSITFLFFQDRVVMKVHEYQAKELLEKAGVAVPEGCRGDNARRSGQGV